MNHKIINSVVVVVVLLLCLLTSLSASSKVNINHKQQTALPSTNLFKAALNRFHLYFFPPNLEYVRFRGSGSRDEAASPEGGGGGTGERVKEAVAKSMEKTKATVEESAKSAAKLATHTVQETAQKVKKSLSSDNTHAEL